MNTLDVPSCSEQMAAYAKCWTLIFHTVRLRTFWLLQLCCLRKMFAEAQIWWKSKWLLLSVFVIILSEDEYWPLLYCLEVTELPVSSSFTGLSPSVQLGLICMALSQFEHHASKHVSSTGFFLSVRNVGWEKDGNKKIRFHNAALLSLNWTLDSF